MVLTKRAGAKCNHQRIGMRTNIWTCELRGTQKMAATHPLLKNTGPNKKDAT